tara:strand:+ start:5672 stop:5887 length:216 start_codon:yes stop_codon:yes gene_type:complete
MKKPISTRTFSSLVRLPYQDAIAVCLHCYDYHMEMAGKGIDPKFHKRQANRLKEWITDMKEYIHELESTDS